MKRSVRFHEDVSAVVCELPNRQDISPEDVERLWFTKEEYSISRNEGRVLCREGNRTGISAHLENTFVLKNKQSQASLKKWSTVGSTLRGLERWSNKDHGDSRHQAQFEAIMTVLDAQDDILAEEGKLDEDKLRRISHGVSKTARHFARMMGKADSHAVAEERESTTATQPAKKVESDETIATANTTRSGVDEGDAETIASDPSSECPEIVPNRSSRRFARNNFVRRVFSSRYGERGNKNLPLAANPLFP